MHSIMINDHVSMQYKVRTSKLAYWKHVEMHDLEAMHTHACTRKGHLHAYCLVPMHGNPCRCLTTSPAW